MYFYSKKSKNKVIHTSDCHFRITSKNLGWFNTLAEAYAAGYRPCKHCDPLLRLYRKEKRRIMTFSRRNALSVFSDGRYVCVSSSESSWKLTLNHEKKPILYHKNTYESYKDRFSDVKGYHRQRDVRKDSIVDYLRYVVEHDLYRAQNPLPVRKKNVVFMPSIPPVYIPPNGYRAPKPLPSFLNPSERAQPAAAKSKPSPAPRKGTKKHKIAMNKEKKIKRAQAIRNVLMLIESLRPQPAASV